MIYPRGLVLTLFLSLQLFPIALAYDWGTWFKAHWPIAGSVRSIPTPLFGELERLARLVDITYCIGNTGISKPFSCLSRCKEFPSIVLERTWSSGVFLGDSCGFIAVDSGEDQESGSDEQQAEGNIREPQPAIYVAFRGTHSLSNTIVDLSTVPQKYLPYPAPGGDRQCANCTVHMGFLQSWHNVREIIVPVLIELRAKNPGYPVHLVGHSLGGAVACLAALELRVAHRWEDVSVTTFGEPRVGNTEMVRYIDEVFGLDDNQAARATHQYRRLTHVDDPVPLLPLSEWGFRSHAGEIFISKKDLSPSESDIHFCKGDADKECTAGAESGGILTEHLQTNEADSPVGTSDMPTRLKLWELFFAHRDYFWRLGLCVPGGDPTNWGKNASNSVNDIDEL